MIVAERFDRKEQSMAKEFIAVLLRSVGGQGGDTLKELLTHAFYHSGYTANSWSKVGLAQRGGSVETYIEASLRPVVFCPHATPGFVDLALGLELFEASSMLEGGFISPERTLAVINISRVYMAEEKMSAGDGILDSNKILESIEKYSKGFFAINASAICKALHFDLRAQNIILFATLPEFPEFGIDEEACVYAMEKLGKNSKENLKVFKMARRLISGGEYKNYTDSAELDSLGIIPSKVRERINNDLLFFDDADLKVIYDEATGRLWNFQHNYNYIRLYRNRIEKTLQLILNHDDFDAESARTIFIKAMRHLGNMMVYHDAPYVARLKLKTDRFHWVEKEIDLGLGEIYYVEESFHPDIMEIVGLLPKRFVEWLAIKEGAFSLPIKVRSGTIFGVLKMYLLRIFEPFRLMSWRYHRENYYIELYLAALEKHAHLGPHFVKVIADTPRIIKGYGETRQKSFSAFKEILQSPMPPTAEELENKLLEIIKTIK